MALPTIKRLILSAGALLVGVGGCLFLYALKLGFTESLYSQRGSFAHFVTVTEPVIRSFPVLDPTNEPQYHSGCGDGPKFPDQAVFYRSRLSAADLSARAQRHITSHGYAPSIANDFPGVAFASGDKTLYLNVTTTHDGATQLNAQVWLDIYQ
jgi:hypothetical protein